MLITAYSYSKLKTRHTCSSFNFPHIPSYIANSYSVHIKTHGSESRGQEEAGLRDEPVSYLQVRSTAVKLVNPLNKPP